MIRLAQLWHEARRITVSGVAPRVVIAVLAVAGLLVVGVTPLIAVLWAVTAVVSVVVPDRAAAVPVVVALALGWLLQYGVHTPSLVRASALAVLLVLLTSAGALAAGLPVSAAVASGVYRRWALGALVPVGVAVALGLLAAIPGTLPGSVVLDAAGLVGALGVAVVLLRYVRRG